MPGEGLLPQGFEVIDRRVKTAEPVASEPEVTDTDRQAPAVAAEEDTREAPATSTAIESASVEQTIEEPATVAHQQEQPVAGDMLMADDGVQGAQTAADQLLATLNQTVLGDRLEITVHRGTVSLDISDSILFGPASAALSAEGLALLNELAAVLQTLPYQLSVEGHTDNVPIQTARYPSNWELSSARAARVTRKLIEQGVAADRIRAIGYGDTRPRSENDSAEGRAKNRRVTFVLQVETEPVSVPAAQ
jgi:chemotaxis protein MotB